MLKSLKWLWPVCLCIVLTQASFGQDDWKKIVVMESTQSDVERLLGRPMEDSTDIYAYFNVGSGLVRVSYSTGFCEPGQFGGWNVEKGIVDGILFFPGTKIFFRKLKLDAKKYPKSFDGDTDLLSYSNEVDGIRYVVANGKVRHIIHFPATRFDSLQCKTIHRL